MTSDIPNVTDYYWANIKVSASPNSATYPTFGNLAVVNDSSNSGYDALAYFRNHADYDWAVIISANNYGLDIRKNLGGSYSLRNAGNSRLIGSTIVGADASPSYTLDVRGSERIYSTYPQLRIENSEGGTNETSMYISNGTAGWAIGINPWGIGGGVFGIGQYSGTGSSTWRFKIDNNGYCYTQSYLNLGAGNEKNASNPPYVWGVNGSDNYLRTYATSSLRVSYASSAGTATNATNANYFIGCTNTITVAGDSNTYYPVMVSTTANKKFRNIITVWKDLGSKTASYSGNHENGSSSMLYRYDIRNCYWDGNGGYCTTLDARYMYARLVSETMMLSNGVGNFCIWLRGGGTEYKISTSWNISLSDITVYYSSTNVGSSTYPVIIAPRTSIGNGGIYNNISIPCDVKYAYSAGNVAWDNITGKPTTATRWPSWGEVTDKPTFTTWSETSSAASYSLSNAAWTNTITLPTTAGSYILNIVSGNSTLTGVFSIGASDNAKDEISLHLHGNGPRLYARTNGTTLQLSSNDASATSRSVTIKYRRMI